jgi:hypothetical protein
MLAGVLLHVIEAADAIDSPASLAFRRLTSHYVRDALAFVDHFNHLHAAKFADVERLAAGRWIKRCAVQIDPPAIRARIVVTYPNDSSLEFG